MAMNNFVSIYLVRTMLLTVLLVSWTHACLAQGTVIFESAPGSVTISNPWSGETRLLPVGGGSVQIIAALAGTPYNEWTGGGATALLGNNPGWTLYPSAPITEPGKFNGGPLTLDVPVGASVHYVVLGWTGDFQTFDDAFLHNALAFGASEKFTTVTGGASNPVSLADSFGGLTLTLIPEPSSLALLLAGAGLFWMKRRSKLS